MAMTLEQMDQLHWIFAGAMLLIVIVGAALIRWEVKREAAKLFRRGDADRPRRDECWEHGCSGYHPCCLTQSKLET
jgi:hypothetical protein